METPTIQPNAEPGLQADQRLLDRGWLRIGAGVAIAAQAMVFSLAVNLSEVAGWPYAVVHGILIVSALGALGFLGGDLVRSAWESVRARRIGIDLLFLVTLAGALVGSLVSTFAHAGSVYYEVVAILIVVHTSGKMLGARSRVAALRAADETREKFELCDVVQADGSVSRTKVAVVMAGARVRVAPGGPIAVDGEIVSGRGYVQETSMTGEWRPEPRGPGDAVLAGTYSVDGSFEVRANGGLRKLDAILETVRQARLAPSELQAQADRLMAWFLPLVVGVSVATFAWWIAYGPWEKALFNAMAVLLVACPCAMGLATPVAVWGGLARLAQFGVVARTGDFLDALARAETVFIDKTGTLSTESLTVREWRIDRDWRDRADRLKAAVAALEDGLPHPVANALRSGICPLPDGKRSEGSAEKYHVLRDTPSGAIEVRNRRIVPGQGVVAEVRGTAADGAWIEFAVGEAGLAGVVTGADASSGSMVPDTNVGHSSNEKCPAGYEGECHVIRDTSSGELSFVEGAERGKAVRVFAGGKWVASVVLDEAWRAGMEEALDGLHGLGLEAVVLSGDPRAEEVLRGLPVRVKAGLAPAQKLAEVEAAVRSGRTVLFVGDGINDAAAMSAAQASIAMRSGAELARASSTAVFVGRDLRFLPEAVALGRAVRGGIRRNLFFASAYNVAGMALAAAGALHPVAAALLMFGSSVFVSVGALRASRPTGIRGAAR